MTIAQKMADLQQDLSKVQATGKNPHFKSTHIELKTALPICQQAAREHGLLLMQTLYDGLVATKLVDPDTGDYEIAELQLPDIQDPQKIGSAITYYRRYTLVTLLGLTEEDDDGNTATKAVKDIDISKYVN